jgi:hypothetical protein
MSAVGSTEAAGIVPPAPRDTMTTRERDRLRRYISANVVGDSPPPITAEACTLIRVALGSDHAGETSSTA